MIPTVACLGNATISVTLLTWRFIPRHNRITQYLVYKQGIMSSTNNIAVYRNSLLNAVLWWIHCSFTTIPRIHPLSFSGANQNYPVFCYRQWCKRRMQNQVVVLHHQKPIKANYPRAQKRWKHFTCHMGPYCVVNFFSFGLWFYYSLVIWFFHWH